VVPKRGGIIIATVISEKEYVGMEALMQYLSRNLP
jgi:hypothetical protein